MGCCPNSSSDCLGAIGAYWFKKEHPGNTLPKGYLQPLLEVPSLNHTSLLVWLLEQWEHHLQWKYKVGETGSIRCSLKYALLYWAPAMSQAPLKAHTFTMDTHCLPSLKIGDEEKDIQEEVSFFFFPSQNYWKISYSCLVSWYLNCEMLSWLYHHFWNLFWVSSHLGEKPKCRQCMGICQLRN